MSCAQECREEGCTPTVWLGPQAITVTQSGSCSQSPHPHPVPFALTELIWRPHESQQGVRPVPAHFPSSPRELGWLPSSLWAMGTHPLHSQKLNCPSTTTSHQNHLLCKKQAMDDPSWHSWESLWWSLGICICNKSRSDSDIQSKTKERSGRECGHWPVWSKFHPQLVWGPTKF